MGHEVLLNIRSRCEHPLSSSLCTSARIFLLSHLWIQVFIVKLNFSKIFWRQRKWNSFEIINHIISNDLASYRVIWLCGKIKINKLQHVRKATEKINIKIAVRDNCPWQFLSLADVMELDKSKNWCSLNDDESTFGSDVLALNIGLTRFPN